MIDDMPIYFAVYERDGTRYYATFQDVDRAKEDLLNRQASQEIKPTFIAHAESGIIVHKFDEATQ